MKLFMRLFSSLVLVVLLLSASAEARTCESLSQRFKGICASNANCASVCQTEGFYGGDCHGFRRRCFCTTPCQAS